ncbi:MULTISPECIES: chaplin family protein [unclassified Streptomyces]|uniref:chaplin family protein n=1 Tax=unclassified Streptomyces TaxID=2593676 RepID=UPI002E79FE85|nr:chaplin family protein [Streptomyces sp. JV184]
MGVETRSADGGAGRASVRAAVLGLGAVAGVALLPAGAAHASVIGIGNAVFGNTCVSQGGTRAAGTTVAGSGVASGNQVGLPLSLPRNHCGNSGIVCTAVFMSSV